MDPASSCSKSAKSQRKRNKSNRDHRLQSDKRENYPNGYLEIWSSTAPAFSSTDSLLEPMYNDNYSIAAETSKLSIRDSKKSGDDSVASSIKFTPVSISLLVENNLILNKANNYEIRFNVGVREGTGVHINEHGNMITFHNDGSYQFEICGEATAFSDVEVSLIYYSDEFSSDIKPFSITKIQKSEGKMYLRGIPTILPMQKGQTIVVKLTATPDESISLSGGTRLLIHRVA